MIILSFGTGAMKGKETLRREWEQGSESHLENQGVDLCYSEQSVSAEMSLSKTLHPQRPNGAEQLTSDICLRWPAKRKGTV